jgi:MOSC domain-containing protein YiiM
MVARGAKVSPGDFAENITTEGVDLLSVSVGSKVRLGREGEVEVTQLGKECHSRCEIFEQVGDCVMPREGIFARVVKGGSIEVGDIVEVIDDGQC